MSNTLCPAPWDHHCINTNGRNRLCCNAVTSTSKFLDGFEEYWHGDEITQVRKQMIDGERPAACVSCWKKEDSGIRSLRQTFIDNYKERNEWKNFNARLHNVTELPIELDLKLGNYCNLSCRMCSSYSSSGYANEFKKIYADTGIDYGINEFEKSFVQGKWYNEPEFVSSIQSMIDNGLRQLKFTGGEPMMVPSVKKLIDYSVENDKAKNIDLVIITNGTLLNQSWIDLLTKFKHVSFILSIDGVDDVFEYIRHPAKWSLMIDVLTMLKSANFYKTIAFTLQVYNMFDIKNIINISREFNFSVDLIALDTPSYLDVSNVSISMKNDALKMIDTIDPINSNEQNFVTSARNKILTATYNHDMSKQLIDLSILKDGYKQQDFHSLEIAKYYD
jgi:sulfatase maturation enzyme AslB (radical SAM superfamily)